MATEVWQWSSADQDRDPHPAAGSVPARHDPAGPTLTPDRSRSGPSPRWTRPQSSRRTSNKTVAGRAAYELVLAPRATARGSARCTSPSTASTRCRSACRSSPAAPTPSTAIDVSFTDINFAVPGDDNFPFTPPPGATVREQPLAMGGAKRGEHAAASSAESADHRNRLDLDPGRACGGPGTRLRVERRHPGRRCSSS